MSESNTVLVKDVKLVFSEFMQDIYDSNSRIEKNRLGKILTIIDGAIPDDTQRKAVKDMVHDAWHSGSHQFEYPMLKDPLDALGIPNNAFDGPIVGVSNKYKELVINQ